MLGMEAGRLSITPEIRTTMKETISALRNVSVR